MNRKKLQTGKYIAAFFIAAMVFIIGLFIGNEFSSQKLDEISQLESDVRIKTIGSEIMYLLLLEDPCSAPHSKETNEELSDIGQKLTFMEQKMGKDDEDVLRLKEFYSLLEARQWIFAKKFFSECEKADRNIVLYFYSNMDDCENCEEQGHVLTYVYKKYPVFDIFSFDVNINNPVLNVLKTMYNVTATPTIVVDDVVYEGFQAANSLFTAINKTKE